MGNIKLRQLPLQVFEGSSSPAGLYARQKWMGESNHRRWHKDFSNTVAALAAKQAPDGSWDGSVGETAKRLFGLHLTVRDADGVVEKGLDWLLAQLSKEDDRDRIAMPTCPGRGTVEGLPFVVSTKRTFLAGVTLFLATIFGRGE